LGDSDAFLFFRRIRIMAISKVKAPNAVRIVSKADGAIDWEGTDWEKYSADPLKNEDSVKFLPDEKPTIFICNFALKGKDEAKIKDAMIGDFNAEGGAKPAIGTWAYAAVKACLKGIENPVGADPIVFKLDAKGLASNDTLDELAGIGIISEIFQYYLLYCESDIKKNSKN